MLKKLYIIIFLLLISCLGIQGSVDYSHAIEEIVKRSGEEKLAFLFPEEAQAYTNPYLLSSMVGNDFANYAKVRSYYDCETDDMNDKAGTNNLTVDGVEYDDTDPLWGTQDCSFVRANTDWAARTNANLSDDFPGKSGGDSNDVFTACLRVKLDAINLNQGLVTKYDTVSDRSWMLYVGGGSNLLAWIIGYSGGDLTANITNDTALSAGVHYLICGAWDNAEDDAQLMIRNADSSCAVHGVDEEDTSLLGVETWHINTDEFNIGTYNNHTSGSWLGGDVDEIIIFNYYLEPEEVTDICKGTYTSACLRSDWGGGGFDESFENKDGYFCNSDWVEFTETDAGDIITKDSGWSYHGSNSMKITTANDADDNVRALTNTDPDTAYFRGYVFLPDMGNNAIIYSQPVIENSGGDDIIQIRLISDAAGEDRVHLYNSGGLSDDYFVYTQGGSDVFRMELYVVDNAGTCLMRLYKNGSQVTETGGDADGDVNHASNNFDGIDRFKWTEQSDAEGAAEIIYWDFVKMSEIGWIGP
jgi:hypothetical protein